MASSNRHWPSLFKSKPYTSTTTTTHQWQQDSNPSHSRTPFHKPPFISEERCPDPKPRWNPKPEQIRILEAIFNSGMVNPPRDEIRKIRTRLQEYGQVGDANVFYWFQNRKSRSKQKQRHLQKQQASSVKPAATTTPSSSSSSSSSDKASTKPSFTNSVDVFSASPSCSVNQFTDFMPTHVEILSDSLLLPPPVAPSDSFCWDFHPGGDGNGKRKKYSEDSVGEVTNQEGWSGQRKGGEVERMKELLLGYDPSAGVSETATAAAGVSAAATETSNPTSTMTVAAPINPNQGGDSCGGVVKVTVLVNNIAFEVVSSAGRFDVWRTFGNDAMLVNSFGEVVATDEWGITLNSLQHDDFYYLIHAFIPPSLEQVDALLF